jgi:hypothetical protein
MRTSHSQRGQALPIVALGTVLLFASAGVAMDMGYMRYERRAMQNAADSAAVAATAELNYGDYVTAGQTDAAANGFTNGVNGVSVTVNTPPTLGQFAGQSNFVEVIVAQSVPTFFMKALGTSSVAVSARAVGHLWGGPDCIFALSPTATDAVLVNGSGTIDAKCGLMDDSSATQALLNNGSGSLTTTGNGVTGGYLNNGTGSISPTPTTSVPPMPDPLAYETAPTVGSCTHSSQVVYNGSGSFVATPGVYCGGILVNGTISLSLSGGTYIINGGNFTSNGTNTITSTGTGVTFYITGGASVTLNGSSTYKLTAPTTGSLAGILFFQNKSDTASATINGSNTSYFTGALYFPGAQLTYNGSGPLTAYTILVANTILFNGSSNVDDDYSSLPNGSPIKTSILAE